MFEDRLTRRDPEGRFDSPRASNPSEYTLFRPSGCPKNQDHLSFAEAYCRIFSYLQTMAYQGYNPLVALQWAFYRARNRDQGRVVTLSDRFHRPALRRARPASWTVKPGPRPGSRCSHRNARRGGQGPGPRRVQPPEPIPYDPSIRGHAALSKRGRATASGAPDQVSPSTTLGSRLPESTRHRPALRMLKCPN